MKLTEIVNLVKNFKLNVLPKKAEFHNSKKITIQKAVGKFNTKHCLPKGFFVHFEQVGESTLYKWKKVTLGRQGPTILERVAIKGGHEIRQDLSPLKDFLGGEVKVTQGKFLF